MTTDRQSLGLGGKADELLVSVLAGEILFERGDAGDTMYVLEDGEIEIVLPIDVDRPETQLAVLTPGDFFGEMAVLEGEPRTATARALTDCRLLPVRGSTFNRLVRRNPEVAVRVMRKLCGRLREVERKLAEVLEGASYSSVSEAPPAQGPGGRPSGSERLVHRTSGREMALVEEAETTVGRPDVAAGTWPDIDLSDLDRENTVSRRHARLVRKENGLVLVEEPGVMNGTFVNRRPIGEGKAVEVKDGDLLFFGLVELELRK